jgi:hypothetical protein
VYKNFLSRSLSSLLKPLSLDFDLQRQLLLTQICGHYYKPTISYNAPYCTACGVLQQYESPDGGKIGDDKEQQDNNPNSNQGGNQNNNPNSHQNNDDIDLNSDNNALPQQQSQMGVNNNNNNNNNNTNTNNNSQNNNSQNNPNNNNSQQNAQESSSFGNNGRKCPVCRTTWPLCVICLTPVGVPRKDDLTQSLYKNPDPHFQNSQPQLPHNFTKNFNFPYNNNSQNTLPTQPPYSGNHGLLSTPLSQLVHSHQSSFLWCTICKHGGHVDHFLQWFSLSELCPAPDCTCQCSLRANSSM